VAHETAASCSEGAGVERYCPELNDVRDAVGSWWGGVEPEVAAGRAEAARPSGRGRVPSMRWDVSLVGILGAHKPPRGASGREASPFRIRENPSPGGRPFPVCVPEGKRYGPEGARTHAPDSSGP
jgi:hypothetical protein